MKYFKLEEFNCPCCQRNEMQLDFLAKLIRARETSDVAYVINSGYRCDAHNKAVGSKTKNHILGRAADIKAVDSRTRFKILGGLIAAGFTRIGIGKTYIHVDDMETENAPPEVCWLY
ncbi:MAG TPA: D-Ala-D-Ala carboxypeptidase family metallohydrolase [Smithellaceae bacterium]|jgi:hypothetical protein|nr:D-Ala-D-Ala carboxypeptidase family metallohydrolase [Smithellaceae bacterium]HRS90187.1 D-Ala-D-Ala carboxypeptidase family metallohydrolase [Smithellaceae bacterium]